MRDREELMTAGDFYPREMVVAPALTKEKESVGVNAKDG